MFRVYLAIVLIFLSFAIFTAATMGDENPVPANSGYLLIQPIENRIKIAIVDTGINVTDEVKPYLCQGLHFDVTGTGIQDKKGHGTNIAGIIAKKIDPKKNCLLIIKYYLTDDYNLSRELKAFELLKNQRNVKYINFSSGGRESNEKEKILIQDFLNKKIKFTTSAGNNATNLFLNCNYYPACYYFINPLFRVVGNGINQNKRATSSNYGGPVTDWRDGMNVTGFGITQSGTSQATAIVTGDLVVKDNKEE